MTTRESEGAPASQALFSFFQIPPLSACDNSNLNESMDGLRVHRSNTLPGANDFETGDIQKNACQLPTIIFGEYGDVTEREPWFATVMVRSYCSKSPPSEPCHLVMNVTIALISREIWLPSYKIFQMSDYVEHVVPSSRGAHGLFQSSLPSQKPCIGHGGWTWDGDGWDGGMDGGWMIWFRDFSNSDLLGNVGWEETWMDLDVFAGDVVAGDG